uniref:Uncharacterized protein n=1 Tax=Arundo donax TaxID=35708 RepID=A0A0A9B0Z8_ARUDO
MPPVRSTRRSLYSRKQPLSKTTSVLPESIARRVASTRP